MREIEVDPGGQVTIATAGITVEIEGIEPGHAEVADDGTVTLRASSRNWIVRLSPLYSKPVIQEP